MIKFPAPNQWAEATVKAHGPHHAAAIAQTEARPLIGPDKWLQPNPNAPYFQNALKWVLKRHPTALEKPKSKRELVAA